MPSGLTTSSSSISPGGVGGPYRGRRRPRLSTDSRCGSVVVCDLNFVGIATLPAETDAKLIVDSNAVLALAIPMQPFESIARRNGQLGAVLDLIDLSELAASRRPDRGRANAASSGGVGSIENVLCALIVKRSYHG